MGPIPLELSLDCRSTWTIPSEEYVPRTVGAFISQVSMIGNVSERMLKLDNYVKRLEDEMRKIDVFKRELPLCMLLLSDAITIVKLELVKYKKENSEPVLEEFIPINKDCEEDGESEEIKMRKDMDSKDNKMNWMSSVQLWNHDHYSPELDSNPKEIPKSNAKKRTLEDKNGAITDNFLKSCSNAERAFVPFNKVDVELQSTKLLSLNSTGIKRTREDLSCSGMDSKIISHTVSSSMPKFQSGVGTVSQVENPTSRKQRRCWSPELHLRFIEALHQLGGCQVATPKQIRELMQVDGLTNDEVKSHLQKYRLHTQRIPATSNTHRDESHALLRGSRMSNRALGESTKQSNILSDSPQSPPQLCGGTSMTSGDSMEDEDDDDDDDEKSESHSWKSHVFDK